MFDKIIHALQNRSDMKGWTLRHIETQGVQRYDLSTVTESVREVGTESFVVSVLLETKDADGKEYCGESSITLLPGEEIDPALDEAVRRASLVENEPYGVPGKSKVPDIPLVDPGMKSDLSGSLNELIDRGNQAAKQSSDVRLTAVEGFAEIENTRLNNSQGHEAQQAATRLHLEWVLIASNEDRASESVASVTRRRSEDIDLEKMMGQHTQYALDLLKASPPAAYQGPVVLRESTLAEFVNALVIRMLSSGNAKYANETHWDIGKSVFQKEVQGDPLNLWATRMLPFGTRANRFDEEGLHAQRVALIQDNNLAAFLATQRFADYLSIPATGAFGDVEIQKGRTPAQKLLEQPHVEVVRFSWFYPNAVSGDFASEIRLGYLVEGSERKPFKGGMLVGNVLDGLANVRWSEETGFFGTYQGPTTARFGDMVVTGQD